jgi:hypothetical protein
VDREPIIRRLVMEPPVDQGLGTAAIPILPLLRVHAGHVVRDP